MTFDPFGDFETRGYLRNTQGLKNSEAIKLIEHVAFRMHIGEVLRALHARERLSYQDILDTHKRLFGDVYPWAGQDRAAIAAHIAVSKAGRHDLFAHPKDVRRAARYALAKAAEHDQMRAKPCEILGLLCHAHPFLEGNGRTLLAVHAELCRRAGFHISWNKIAKSDYLAALTRELEQPGTALDTLLAPHLQPTPATLTQDTRQLRKLQGLGPDPLDAGQSDPDLFAQILKAMRPPESTSPPPWEPPPTPMAERVRAFEERMKRADKPSSKTVTQPDADPEELPKPRPGPKP